MKTTLFLFSIFGLVLLSGCADSQATARQRAFQEWSKDNGRLKVLSTTAMIDDLVKQIGGEHISNLTLIQGELDPHSYQLVKGDDEKLAMATIIFHNGLGLEHGPSLQHYLHGSDKAVALGDRIEANEPEAVILIEGQRDPHIWTDASLWAKTVPFIVEALSQNDPVHAAEYKANGQQLLTKLAQAHSEVRDIMQQVPASKRYLVTSHDAFNYFARAYLSEPGEREDGRWEKRFAAPEGLSPESQLSTTDIRLMIDYMRRHQIHVIFPESNVSRDSIKKILDAGKEQGLDLTIACCPLYGDAMGPPGSEGETYLKMIVYNAKMIASYLK